MKKVNENTLSSKFFSCLAMQFFGTGMLTHIGILLETNTANYLSLTTHLIVYTVTILNISSFLLVIFMFFGTPKLNIRKKNDSI